MCVVYFLQNDIVCPDGYQLVLVNNRDEHWTRPTKDADFWGPDLSCLSGRDMHPGKEGGTWLGINKNGKIGVVLNILGPVDLSKKGRGFLVSDYLCQDVDMEKYAAEVRKDRDEYHGFILLLFDLGRRRDCLRAKPLYVTNALGYNSCVNMGTLSPHTFHGVSNSPLEYPFQKVIKGKQRFGQIVSQYPTVDLKEHLVKDLMELMADTTELLPDPVLEKAVSAKGLNPAETGSYSAVNIFSSTYRSRTTTIILVDGKGTVDYIERSVEPSQSTHHERTMHKTFQLSVPLTKASEMGGATAGSLLRGP
ncbi:transport and Golgi organization 2 homolog [Plakobranchus ocellatus]|uniref:Transport and Golgi organization 2 homolog n=1 Tax=Plakobranchus ocellatus TaxID=259542 RepID=A0AAV4DGV1_9GAST|nr:transport and Golgi organization 2 homolog [Plakobranchus ocellatus]